MGAFFEHEYKQKVLQVQDVSLSLGGKLILDRVNFEIRNVTRPDRTQGQVVGLLGPSGIGKTQLFHLLAGLKQPDQGQVLIGDPGEVVRSGKVGVVAQHYPLFAHRTVMSNLMVAGEKAAQSTERTKERAEQLLDRFRLLDHAHKYPSQLSGGQRQRVAIAQQIMCSEQFLLMDEPFSGLDLMAMRKVQELIVEIGNQHELNTVILVSHDVVAMLEICDTVLLLGRNSDAQGKLLPGARIQATYNLVERGLAWRQDVAALPEFAELLREIRSRFALL